MKYRKTRDMHADIDEETYLAFATKCRRLRVPLYHVLNLLLKEWVEESGEDTRDYTWTRIPHGPHL